MHQGVSTVTEAVHMAAGTAIPMMEASKITNCMPKTYYTHAASKSELETGIFWAWELGTGFALWHLFMNLQCPQTEGLHVRAFYIIILYSMFTTHAYLCSVVVLC